MAQLVISPGTAQARKIPLQPGIVSIGRGPANDVTLDDGSVSGSHCQLIISDSSVRIRDLGSTNGTFINGAQINEAPLEAGQRIQLGSAQLMFEADEGPRTESVAVPLEAAPPPPPPPGSPARPVVRLRVAKEAEESATVQVVSPEPKPVPVEDTAILALNAPVNAPCKYHPKTLARWICTGCHKTYCDLCVTTRPSAVGQKFCRSCAATCAPLSVIIETPKERGFFSELPRAIVYPFRGTGVLVLIGATIVFAALEFLSRGIFSIITKALAIGYVFAYVQNIIHSTAAGDDKLPDLPGMDGLFGNFFRLAGTVLMAFGPALVAAYLAIWQEMPAAGIAIIPTVVFGCLYFPMAFLAVAMKDNVLASNPLVVVPSILRVPLEYIVAAILVAGVFAVRWAGDAISKTMGSQALFTDSMSEMFLLFGLRVLWAFVSVYLLTATMRVLGLLYLTKRDRLGW